MWNNDRSKRRREAIDTIIDASSRVLSTQTSSVSLYSDPTSWAVTRAITNCAQIVARWVSGNISGEYALIELCREGGGVVGGMSGAALGGIIGHCIFPFIGGAIGAALGGFLGYRAGKYVISRSRAIAVREEDSPSLKQDVYETALEEFGLDQWASNQAVEASKKAFSLRYHPDRNRGNEEWAHEMFCKYMTCYSIIRGFREANGWW